MPFIDLTVQHGRTLEEARRRLETAVQEISSRLGSLVRRVDWATDRNRVKLEGVGFWVEMSVDAHAVHAKGDIPVLGGMLGAPLAAGVKQIVQQIFQKQLQP